MTDNDFQERLTGSGLLTTEILYWMPNHPSLLQSFCFQSIDKAPQFPKLHEFLDHWRKEVEATIHSIRIAHSDWIGPSEVSFRDGEFRLH